MVCVQLLLKICIGRSSTAPVSKLNVGTIRPSLLEAPLVP